MPHPDHVGIDVRERWLPLVQAVAEAQGWQMRGNALEMFVDAVAPYLAQPEIGNVELGVRVLRNYYVDAPLVKLLCEDETNASNTMWNAIRAQITISLQPARGMGLLENAIAGMLERLREVLQHHTYQIRVSAILARLIQEELEQHNTERICAQR
jgi:hypothetical protein